MASDYFTSPVSLEEADGIVQAICQNPSRVSEPLRKSIHLWDGPGAGLFARAAKNCYQYQSGNNLGVTLRSLANTAIIIEHRQAHR